MVTDRDTALAEAMKKTQAYRRHRTRLLGAMPKFRAEWDDLRDHIAQLTEQHRCDPHQAPPKEGDFDPTEPTVRARVLADPFVPVFQIRWRVKVDLQLQKKGWVTSFSDWFFADPVRAALTPAAIETLSCLLSADPGRYLVVDRHASWNEIRRMVPRLLLEAPAVSRTSPEPFRLDDSRNERNFALEDRLVVGAHSGDEHGEVDYRVLTAIIYPDAARDAGYDPNLRKLSPPKKSRRLQADAVYEQRKARAKWTRLLRGVRTRWEQIRHVLGPFDEL